MTNKSQADGSREAVRGIPRRDWDDAWPAGPMDELAAMLEKERCDDYRAVGSDRYVGADGEARIEGMWRHRICEW